MTLQVALFIFGAVLFLIGLIGKIKTSDIKIGTNRLIVRGISLLLGTVLMFLAFDFISKQRTSYTLKPIEISTPEHDLSDTKVLIAEVTLQYWNQQGALFRNINKDVYDQDHLISSRDYKNKNDISENCNLLIVAMENVSRLIGTYYKESVRIPVNNVDPELVNLFLKIRDTYFRVNELNMKVKEQSQEFCNIYYEKMNAPLSISGFEKQLHTSKFETQLSKVQSKLNHLLVQIETFDSEDRDFTLALEHLRVTLTNRYKIEFPSVE